MSRELHIFSAGQDSTFVLGQRLFERFKQHLNTDNEQVYAISFNYGQRHASELKAAKTVLNILANCFMTTINHYTQQIDFLDSAPLNEGIKHYSDIASMQQRVGDGVESTYVPFRNLTFIVRALSAAQQLGFGKGDAVYIGICANDSANYPDCTVRFFDAVKNLMETLNVEFELKAPLLNLTKQDQIFTVKNSYWHMPIYEAWAYTQTSYDGDYPPLKKNHSNLLRNDSFKNAELCDPLLIRAVSENLVTKEELIANGFYYNESDLPAWYRDDFQPDYQSLCYKTLKDNFNS